MTSFVIYTIVLLLLAFLLGAVIGCMFRRWWLQDETATGEDLKPDRELPSEVRRATASDELTSAPAVALKPESDAQSQPANVQLFAADEPSAAASAGEETKPAAPARKSKARARKAASAKPRTKPKARTAAKSKTAAKAAKADDLKKLKGVGQKIEGQLHEAGINSFAQIAEWTKKDIEDFDNVLRFRGRIERDDWVGQAKLLAAGEDTDFSKRAASGEVPTSASKARSKGARARKKS